MVINIGYLQGTKEDSALDIRIYYDNTVSPDQPQALIDGPRGWCLDVKNATGTNQRLDVTLPNGTTTTLTFGQGDPVTSGPASGRSRTAAQMASLGYTLRSDVSGFSLG